MAVSTDERREVAARLRDVADCEHISDAADFGVAIKRTFREMVPIPRSDRAFLRTIADLIEPDEKTCCKELMTWFFPATELTPYREVEYFGCSWCGEYLSDTDCYGLDDGPNYCSNCGRMVDKSFVTDGSTGEVIYRDGVKVVEQ